MVNEFLDKIPSGGAVRRTEKSAIKRKLCQTNN